jgi:hypothetical protein
MDNWPDAQPFTPLINKAADLTASLHRDAGLDVCSFAVRQDARSLLKSLYTKDVPNRTWSVKNAESLDDPALLVAHLDT